MLSTKKRGFHKQDPAHTDHPLWAHDTQLDGLTPLGSSPTGYMIAAGQRGPSSPKEAAEAAVQTALVQNTAELAHKGVEDRPSASFMCRMSSSAFHEPVQEGEIAPTDMLSAASSLESPLDHESTAFHPHSSQDGSAATDGIGVRLDVEGSRVDSVRAACAPSHLHCMCKRSCIKRTAKEPSWLQCLQWKTQCWHVAILL